MDVLQMTPQELAAAKRKAQKNLRDALHAGAALLFLWIVTVVVALSMMA